MKQNTDYRITLNETNVVKCVAICAMLWHHLFYEHPEYGEGVFHFALIGKVCVALFVFLSGYGMATNYQKKETGDSLKAKITDLIKFLARRYLKFYLSYWLIFCITVPLGVFIFGRPLSAAYGDDGCIWTNLAMDWFGLQVFESYNITWWFNRLILALWLLFPFFYWSMKSRIVCIWMLILLYFDPGGILYPLHKLAPGFIPYAIVYTLGIFVAIYIEKINQLLNLVRPNIVITASIGITIMLLYVRNTYVVPYFFEQNVDPFIAVFISLSVVSLCRLTRRDFRLLTFIGKHSMNMYLLHTFVFGYFFSNFIYGFKYPMLIFAVLFSISLLLSVVLEFMKRKTGFYKLQDIITTKLI